MSAAKQFCKARPDLKNEHKISSLWKMFQRLVPPDHMSAKNNGNVERILKQVEELDPRSMDSRYALGMDFATQSLPSARALDLNVVRPIMDRLNVSSRPLMLSFSFLLSSRHVLPRSHGFDFIGGESH